MTDLERVARAIALEVDIQPEVGYQSAVFLRGARAALEALVEPSDVTLAAGRIQFETVPGMTSTLSAGEAKAVWRAMLRHILEAKPE